MSTINRTDIEWTDFSVNPFKLELPDGRRVNACVKISPGCRSCYAESIIHHYWPKDETKAGRGFPGYSLPLLQMGKPWLDTELLRKLLRWKPKPPFKSPDGRPKVFAFDMTDFFLDLWPDDFLDQFMAVVAIRQDIDFQVLTKRPERMLEYLTDKNTPFRVAKNRDCLLGEALAAESPEEIKPIPEYPGYFISNKGSVFTSSGSSVCLHCGAAVNGIAKKKYCSRKCRWNADYHRRAGHTERHLPQLSPMSPDAGEQGHLRVMFYKAGNQHRELVHRIVLTVFVGPPPSNDSQCCHVDGNPSNNKVENLRWGSQETNWTDSKRHGTHSRSKKIDRERAEEIRRRCANGESTVAVGKDFGITDAQVRNVVSGKHWSQESDVVFPLPNLFLGVSVENQQYADQRIPILLRTPAAVRFVSYEPALGPVDFDAIPITVTGGFFGSPLRWHHRGECHKQAGIEYPTLDWIIVGGESGPQARPFNIEWARQTIEQCKAAKVACFVKQIGASPYHVDEAKKIAYGKVAIPVHALAFGGWKVEPGPKDSHGGDPSEWPEWLRVREWPKGTKNL